MILSSLPRTSQKRNNTADTFMECFHDLEYSNIDKGMPFKDETLNRAYSYLMTEGTAEARKKHHVVKTQAMYMAATLIQYGGIATSDEERKDAYVNHR